MTETDDDFLRVARGLLDDECRISPAILDRLFALARRGAAIEPWKIAADNHQLRIRLLAFITRYDRDNPMRTADVHDPDCGCMRCERDRAATLIAKGASTNE